jgi:mono/diheme cytochrome c family protein
MAITRNGLVGLGMVGASLLAAACGGVKGGTAASTTQTPSQAAVSAKCVRRAPGVGAARHEDQREGSQVALARLGDRTIAYVADEDDGVLHTVDVSTGKELTTTALAGQPAQVLVAKDGRVIVAIRDKSQVQVLEPQADPGAPLSNLCSIDTPAEPVALASSPDDATVFVTSGWGRALTALDADAMKTKFRVPLARDPRSVVISDDGSHAFIAHVVGSRLSSVDLRAPEHPVRTVDMSGSDPSLVRRSRNVVGLLKGAAKGQQRMGCQSFALAKSVDPPGRIFAPQVLVDPGDTEQTTSGYGDGFRAAEVASIGVLDDGTGEPLDASLRLSANETQMGQAQKECLLPRAAATDPSRRSLFVTCLGIDSLVEYDAASADPRTAEKHRWQVGSGPTGLALDHAGQRAIVWSQFDQSLAVVSLTDDAKAKPAILALSRRAKSAVEGDVALGRKLFHSSGDLRISADGRACASCHPDGRDDSLTWATPEGPRNTPMLAGRLQRSGPFGWNGSSDSVSQHLHQTMQRLRGRGLEENEIAALEAYATSLPGPEMRVPHAGPEATRIARGKELFESGETSCASCHPGGGSVDGIVHDIGSRAHADAEAKFDTPSLRFVGGTAPYFHDGRYRTLRELLVGVDGKMGHTSQLSGDDLDALEAYMRSL